MKKYKFFSFLSAVIFVVGIGMTSCEDKLDLPPIDYYGAGNFWKTEDQAIGNIHAQMSNFRGHSFNTNIIYGELRGGAYTLEGTGSDGAILNQAEVREQNLTQSVSVMSNFGGYWGSIDAANLFIYNVEQSSYFSSEEDKNYCLGIAYGLRAYYYFVMYRNYGGVPLRLTPEVSTGNYDQSTLYQARATASETMAQIKSDISKSLNYFGSQTTFNFRGAGKNAKYYWSKAATEMLAGEVYLWNAKVAVGDQSATPGDLSTAKSHFQNVINNYGLSLEDDFEKVFDAQNKQNKEIILAIMHSETESANGIPAAYNYGIVTGYTIGTAYDSDGKLWKNPHQVASTVCRYQFSNALWYQFDENDTRRDATFTPSWHDSTATQLRGTFVHKNLGNISSSTGYRAYDGDQPIYRLALAHLSLAEIANMEDDAKGVEENINLIRKRAYGKNWNDAKHGFKAGSFTENEVAILHEKDKEFIQEGQRWYDVRRMTAVKNGSATDHLLFRNEGHIAYGLNMADGLKELSPDTWENAPLLVVTPILSASDEFRALWPLSTSDLNADKLLTQNPGYEMK